MTLGVGPLDSHDFKSLELENDTFFYLKKTISSLQYPKTDSILGYQ